MKRIEVVDPRREFWQARLNYIFGRPPETPETWRARMARFLKRTI